MSEKLQIFPSVQALLLISAMSPGATFAATTTSASDSSGLVLEEIIVTAERRAEPLQSTPIAVTALSAETLNQQSVVNLSEVATFLPNVNIATGRGSSTDAFIFIRGIGQANNTGNSDPGVGEYVDDVYLGRIQGGLFDLNDVASVEVLRGPQGTLYGKNTIGGAITVNSKMPGNEPEYNADLAYGDYNYTKLGAVVSVPVIEDRLFCRVSASSEQNAGFMANSSGSRTNKIDYQTGRFVLRALPTDKLELVLSVDGSIDSGGEQNGRLVALANPPTPLLGLATKLIGNPAPYLWQPGQNPYKGGAFDAQNNPALGAPDLSNNTWGVSLRATWDLGAVTLKSISAYRTLHDETVFDTDETPLNLIAQGTIFTDSQLSQELRLSGNAIDRKLDWLAGFFYFHEKTGAPGDALNVSAVPALIPLGINAGFSSKANAANSSEAGYVHASYKITDKLKVTVGARMTYEQKYSLTTTYFFDTTTIQPGGAPGPQRVSFQKFTPTFVLDYQLTPTQFVYASASEGYKSGGFNGFLAGASLSYNPETAWTYEVGLKSQFFDRRLTSNWAGFYTQYSSIQEQLLTSVNGNIVNLTTNATEAHMAGLENETNFRVTPELTVFGNLGYINTKYTHFVDARLGDLSGNQFQDAPKFNGTIGTRYEQRTADSSSVAVGADYAYKSKTYFDILNTPQIAQPGYGVINARASLFLQDHKTEIALFGKNLGDKYYIQNGASILASFGVAFAYFGAPRTYGVELRSHF